jgi:choline dehydrogenase-like flavoprotein
MDSREVEFLIVGSGAGGATLARELARKQRDVLVLERGSYETQIGTLRDSFRYMDNHKVTKHPITSQEDTILWRALMAGGSTVVSLANMTSCLQEELAEYGITLERELAEAEKEIKFAPIDETLVGEGSRRVGEAAGALGYTMERMPKAIDPAKCKRCGTCTTGCQFDAKWTALDYLQEAAEQGADLVCDTRVLEVLVENGRARGVKAVGPAGVIEYRARTVILAAGGLSTPVILQASGIDGAGMQLFIDLYVNTVGVTKDYGMLGEPAMALVNHQFQQSKGFILSPYVPPNRASALAEYGAKGLALRRKRLIGLMAKTADELEGRVYPDGTFSKPVTKRDWARLNAGSTISTEILIEAGADPKSILVSKAQGAHPGGTAAIGKIVDRDLQTEIGNLFVCDASVLPKAAGLPPILTIVALAKRLGQALAA